MIDIKYYRGRNRVSITGHALSGEAGYDLVCASVSALALTLGRFVENLRESKQSYNTKTELKEGNAIISCEPPLRYKSSVTLVFDSICAGFEMIAAKYPENVKYSICI